MTRLPATDRRRFLVGSAALGAATALFRPGSAAAAASRTDDAASADRPPVVEFPRQDSASVREVVGKSHFDIDRVRELVTARPALAKAAIDWGFGDWESALGAASHTGRREIALLLLAHGARPTLFSAAMLGQLDVVRATIEADPAALRIPGPHGIPLLDHALAGGEPAAAVARYLESVGADEGPAATPLDDALRDRILGRYPTAATSAAGGLVVEISLQKTMRGDDRLTFTAGDGTGRGLTHLGDLAFHPAGAEAVRIAFDLDGDDVRLSIEDGPIVVEASRAGA